VEHKNYIEKVKELLMRIKSDVVSGIDKMELEETAFYEELLDNIQYGISNHVNLKVVLTYISLRSWKNMPMDKMDWPK
jgi:uncharacterized protein YlaN (UPF0358 family)